MQFKRLIMPSAILSAVVSTAVMAQPSAKFAAVWTDGLKVIESQACDSTIIDFCDQIVNTGADMGTTMAHIKVPKDKELLVGISAQIALMTETVVKGKRGSYSSAMALAEGGVEVMACNWSSGTCYEGEPGYITLSSRKQELEAVLGGIIEECTFDVELALDYGEEGPEDDVAAGSATWTLEDCTVKQEEIGLALTTMAAHHFNFVFPDLPQGDYSVIATFNTDADAAASASCPAESIYCEDGDGDASAISHAVIGKTMMTIEGVRAVKGSLDSMEFLEVN